MQALKRSTTRRRQRATVLTALASASLLGSMLVSNVLAVHDEGVFQLDGNAITAGEPSATQDNPGTFSPAAAHDWSQVYADRAAGTPAGSGPFPNSGAVAQSFITDITGAGDSILTGGSTKDIYDLPSWLLKQTATTSVQDKDDIEHAFAAQYSVNKSGGQCGSAGPQNPCVLLYFGADRFANSGSTTMGFWFYKSRVQALGPDAAGNGTFTGTHTARSTTGHGDILIVSDFLIGGAAPTVSVFEWVDTGGSASTHLDLIGGGTATLASCTAAPPVKKNGPSVPPVGTNDDLCATTNQNVITTPWSFTAKTGQTGPQVSEFMEGGINMTALGLGNECFNSFLAETRASPSPTSTLSDFALGNFGSCGATAVTTPSADTGDGAVAPGTGVTDHFVVTGTSSGGTAPFPTSATANGGHNVFFSFCGPMLVTDTTGTCSGGDAAHTAGASFDNEALANTADQGVSDARSTAINTAGNALAPGRYCFVGSWAGDNNYTDGASDSSARECFVVRILQPSLTTAQSFVPNDSATVAVAAGAGNLAGTLRLQLFVNSITCGGTAAYDSGAIDITTGSGTGLSRTLTSSNTTAYSTNGTTFSWLATYTSTNSGQNGVTAACNAENSSISVDNGGTFNTP